MGKKPAFLAGAIIIALLIHACELPTSVKIKADNLKLSIPIRIGRFDVASMISDLLEDSLKDFDGELRIYDMEDYTDSQAFLVSVKMDMAELFDPGEYLDQIKDQLGSMDGIMPGDSPAITTDPIEMPEIDPVNITESLSIELKEEFQTIEDQMNGVSITAQVLPVPVPANNAELPINNLPNLPTFMLWDESIDVVFSSAVVHDGYMKLIFTYDDTGLDSSVSIWLRGIQLKTDNGDFNAVPSDVFFDSANLTKTVNISLANAVISGVNPPQIVFNGIETTNTTSVIVPAPLNIQPSLHEIELRGIKGLMLDDYVIDDGELLENIENALKKLSDLPSELINAEIGIGTLSINLGLPQEKDDIGETYCKGLKVSYEFYINQGKYNFGGDFFPGLSGESGDPWEISGSNSQDLFIDFAVTKKEINKEDVEIVYKPGENGKYCKIAMSTGDGIDFEFFGDTDLADKTLTVTMVMDFVIEELKTVRWIRDANIDELFSEKEFTIDFNEIGGEIKIKEFINSIIFGDVTVGLDFTIKGIEGNPNKCGLPKALQGRLGLSLTCDAFDFDDNFKPLKTGLPPGDPGPFLVVFSAGHQEFIKLPDTITIQTKIIPKIGNDYISNSGYIEIGPVSVGEKFELYAKPHFDFAWEEALVDIKKALSAANVSPDELAGKFPEAEKKGVDLKDNAGKYMSGISLSDKLKAKIFFTGPKQLIDALAPKLNFGAEWQDEDDENETVEELFFRDTLKMTDISDYNELLPDKNDKGQYIYKGTELPGKPGEGMVLDGFSLVNAISKFPRDLRFTYELEMDTVVVSPGMFDFENDGNDGDLSILFVMMVPLELVVEKDGKFMVPDDVFGDEGKDLFGRESLDEDSVFTDINVKSLTLRIDFHDALFRWAVLYLDADRFEEPDPGNPNWEPPDILFPNGLSLDSGNSIQVVMSSKDWEIIRSKLIVPNIEIIFSRESKIKIPREFMPTKITIAASGDYTIDLEDLDIKL